jgi:predicted SprT family Zn-dependent metalloprotease
MKAKAIQKNEKEDYHIACQNCGATDKPIHIIPLRNEKNVVGLVFSCDNCGSKLYGQRFDIEKV